jgi:hypothetical protein
MSSKQTSNPNKGKNPGQTKDPTNDGKPSADDISLSEQGDQDSPVIIGEPNVQYATLFDAINSMNDNVKMNFDAINKRLDNLEGGNNAGVTPQTPGGQRAPALENPTRAGGANAMNDPSVTPPREPNRRTPTFTQWAGQLRLTPPQTPGVNSPENPLDPSVPSDEPGVSDPAHEALPAPRAGSLNGRVGIPYQVQPNMLDRAAAAADTPWQKIQVTQALPSYEHIKLQDLKFRSAAYFVEKILEYQTTYGLDLPVSTLVSTGVRDTLLMNGGSGITQIHFYQLTTKEIITLIRQAVKPKTMLDFRNRMSENWRFPRLPENYYPEARTFNLFWEPLMQFCHRAVKVYEMAAADNAKNHPKVNDKPGGLIKIFNEKIPFEYAVNVYNTALQDNKYKDLKDYIRDFLKAGHKHWLLYQQVLDLEEHWGGTAYQAMKIARSSGKPLSKPVQPSNRDKRHRINNIELPPEPVVDYASDDPQDYLVLEDKAESEQDESEDETAELDDEEGFNGRLNELMAVQQPKLMHRDATRPTANSSHEPKPCFSMILSGTCPKGKDCSYSHDPKVLAAGRAKMIKDVSSRNYGTVNAISIPAVQDYEGFEPLLQNVFSEAVPEAALFKAVHHEGVIETMSAAAVKAAALFDTGAVHGSYISQKWVEKHRAALQPFIVQCKCRVKLADNETQIDIDEYAILTVTFQGLGSNKFVGSARFWILKSCSHDMIVGLPAILTDYLQLHKDMLESAFSAGSRGPSQLNLIEGDIKQPWSVQQETEAPEDLDTPLPCSFSWVLHYMEMSHDDALKEYHDLLDTHVDKEFSAATPILQLLRDEGVKAFVPQNWDGIKGIPPIELRWKDGLPASLKPRARPVNPRLFEDAQREFNRLLKYFYEPSTSPHASCLVIAPKATSPYIRFCGDYVTINSFIETPHTPIPRVQHALERIMQFSIFLDFDLANSFHQFRLGPITSGRLSVQTPWGQVQPKFMPEGIGPASGILQQVMYDVFADFIAEGWVIAIFDNILVLAYDFQDAYDKVKKIIARCIERNLVLKFSKTWLGFKQAKFFGYIVKRGCYELGEDRKQTINEIPFPRNTKAMQSFLGAALFFRSFIPHYSSIAAHLNDMVKKDFNWDPSTWKIDYQKIFRDFKTALSKSTSIFYPDYSLDWTLRTDASTFGVGAVLLQKAVSSEGIDELQPISFASAKFSPQATRWTTIEQEMYAIYWAVFNFSYYLRC